MTVEQSMKQAVEATARTSAGLGAACHTFNAY